MLRAKFKLNKVTLYEDGGELELFAVTSGSKENDEFFKYTPNGKISMTIVSQKVLGMVEVGQEYYIDIIPASDES